MTYAIIGSGKIGSALARSFAAKNIDVVVANSRGPVTAYDADVIFLAVPFRAHADVAKLRARWDGKIIVDATNAFGLSVEEHDALGGLSSEVVARAFIGARVVKGFNHLPAAQLGSNPAVAGQRQAIFLSSNDADASTAVAALATQLGFAPIQLGAFDRGGLPLHVVGGERGGLLLQNLVKLD